MKESIAFEKAIAFALRIVGLYKYLTEQKREYVISKQILLSGAYIPKHINIALHARSKQAFSCTRHSRKALILSYGSCYFTEASSLATICTRR